MYFFFFFKQKTAYEMRISDWSSDVCSSDLLFGIEYLGAGFRFFAVEIDRNTESIERKNLKQNAFGVKITAYLDVLRRQSYRSHWGIPKLPILTVTTNEIGSATCRESVCQ